MTTKPNITITPTENNIQFDIRQGNQTRWFSVEVETAKELYEKLGNVLGEKEQEWSVDWIEREMAAFLDRKGVERDYERQHVPKIVKEGLE